MTIDEIFISNKISVRTRNICKNNGLNDLQSIINFYNDKNSFLNLRNCGRKSNEELISLCIQKDDSFNLSNLNGYIEIISNTFNNLNKSVDKMFQNNEISFRTRNICKSNKLDDLDSIINHLKKYQSFLNIKNCGDKSNEELIFICKKNDIIINKEKPITLEVDNIHNLLKLHFNKLSNKSKKYIENYLKGDLSIKNISEKIIFNSEFKYSNIRNFGEKSIQELKCFFDYTKFIINSNHDLKINQKQFLTYNSNVITSDFNFTDDEIEEIDNYIKINLNKLSIRSSKIISSYLKGKFNTHNFIDKILKNNDFYSQALKNTSEYSKKELNDFIASIEKCIPNYFKYENQLDFQKNINYFEESKLILRDQFFEKKSIFKLVDFKISQNKIFNKNENIIFQKGFKIYQNQVELSLIEIANELNLTNARVRQKRKSVLVNLFKGFEFIKNLEEDIYQKYNIDSNQLIIDLDYELINKDNKTNFSKEFITFIIYISISDKFELVGELEDVFLPKYKISKDRHNWSKFYIINKDLTKIFDFNNFIQDLNKRLNERIEETYSFPFNSYLSNFMKEDDNTQITLLQPVVEKIINEEFDIFIDFNENIVFERNTVKQVHEYAIEVLEKLGVPSNIEEIFNYIEKDFTEITKSKEALRGSLKRTSEIIYFGRSSTYGLKKWENEKEGIKGGTIRSIVIKFLELESEPIHISKISKHVLKYRPDSNQKSIYYNLKMDESNSFIFFKDSYVGLIQKNYDKAYELISIDDRIEKKSWEERYSDLTNFLNQNSRLPFSSGCPENEIKLYRWYKIQVVKTIKGQLEEGKMELINNIFTKIDTGESIQSTKVPNYTFEELIDFMNLKMRIPDSKDQNESGYYKIYKITLKKIKNSELPSNQNLKFKELIDKFKPSKNTSPKNNPPKYTIENLLDFLTANNRMPNSRELNERGLYQFAYKQRKLFENGDLDQIQVEKIVEISNEFKYFEESLKYLNSKNISMEDLKFFVLENLRLPVYNRTDEEKLFRYYHKQKSLFKSGLLDQSEALIFNEISKTIQNRRNENKRK